MITIDGAQGEGGGQVLRTSLSLSLITGQPFRITNIRANRSKPGLMRQHLTAVQAAGEVGGAEVVGAAPGSKELTFIPGAVKPGEYRFAVGTAGSTMLIFQTLLPALLHAKGVSNLVLEGGTHNPHAPPFDFVRDAFIPVLARIGHRVDASLERFGFYPAGGGKCSFTIYPTAAPQRVELLTRGEIKQRRARVTIAGLSFSIAERELSTVRAMTGWDQDALEVRQEKNTDGPGNVLTLTVASENITEVFTGFGERGVPAEVIAERTVKAMREYLASAAAVGEHLADQLLLPLVIEEGGTYRTLRPTAHTFTNMDVIRAFIQREISVTEEAGGVCRIEVV